MDDEWKPIETAPLNKNIMMWWRPRADPDYPRGPDAASPLSNNRHAECCVVGQVSSYSEGMWWDGDRYQDIWHVTHWRHLPKGPY